MPFKVCRISGTARLDSLPVAVIKDYPLEKRDYKPFAQCNFGLTGEGVLLRMWAFEVLPPDGSELRGAFYLYPENPGTALIVSMRPEDRCDFFLLDNGREQPVSPPDGFALRPHSGEDLQGVYWGGLAALPLDWLTSLGGNVCLDIGDTFKGNFYKLCPGPEYAHQGSFFPADFLSDPYGVKSMGEFLVVSY